MDLIKDYMADWEQYKPHLLKESDELISKYNLFKKPDLLPHQKQGIREMISLYEGGRNAYLADQMGLGKTIQCIKMIQYFFEKQKQLEYKDYCLVIAPINIHSNWKQQLKIHLPEYPCYFFNSSNGHMGKLRECAKMNISQIFIIANYVNESKKQLIVCRNKPGIIILDEAQSVKNSETQLSHFMKKVKAKMKVFVSGTPFSNNLSELIHQLSFISPDLFTSEMELSVQQLESIIDFFIIRRTKNEIVSWNFPKKHQKVQYLQLTEAQREVYKSYVINDIDNLQDIGANQLVNLMKVCDHPNLSNLQLNQSNEELIDKSTKLIELCQILNRHISNKERVIVFTRMIKTANLIQQVCRRKKYSTTIIHGQILESQKLRAVQNYHQQPTDVFISTVKTGGIGLTLIEANIVVLFNTDWNPQVDNQAIDRVHRIGQTKDVTIYRLICEGTAEQKTLSYQNIKLQLEEKIIKTNRHSKLFVKSDDEKQQMFDEVKVDWGPRIDHSQRGSVASRLLSRKQKPTLSLMNKHSALEGPILEIKSQRFLRPPVSEHSSQESEENQETCQLTIQKSLSESENEDNSDEGSNSEGSAEDEDKTK